MTVDATKSHIKMCLTPYLLILGKEKQTRRCAAAHLSDYDVLQHTLRWKLTGFADTGI